MAQDGEHTYLVATEANMIYPLEKAAPQHKYIPVPGIMTSTGETCACNRCPHMARNTLGRRILEQGQAYADSNRKGDPPIVRFMNKEYPLKARVVKLGGFSAHGDKDEMCRILEKSDLKIKKIALVHGEEDQILAFEKDLKGRGFNVVVPRRGETIPV